MEKKNMEAHSWRGESGFCLGLSIRNSIWLSQLLSWILLNDCKHLIDDVFLLRLCSFTRMLIQWNTLFQSRLQNVNSSWLPQWSFSTGLLLDVLKTDLMMQCSPIYSIGLLTSSNLVMFSYESALLWSTTYYLCFYFCLQYT